jgi:hypothetical protein
VRRIPVTLLERMPAARLAQRGGGDEDSRLGSAGRRAHEGHLVNDREPLVGRRRLELAKGAHLRGRHEHARFAPRELAQLLGSRKRAEPREQPLDQIDLRLGKRRRDPDAPHREAMPGRRLDDVAPGRAGEVRVVEDHPPHAQVKLLAQLLGQPAQRPPLLVAVETQVAAGDVLLGDTALPGSGNAHHEHHLPIVRRTRSLDRRRAPPAERTAESCSLAGIEPDLGGPDG